MSDESYNIYDEEENVIANDSSGDEDNDDLMDVAVSSLKVAKPVRIEPPATRHKLSKKRTEKERLRLKKKYIVWTNKKYHRERVINYFLPSRRNRRKYDEENHARTDLNESMETVEERAEFSKKKNESLEATETIDLDDTDIEDEVHDDYAHNVGERQNYERNVNERIDHKRNEKETECNERDNVKCDDDGRTRDVERGVQENVDEQDSDEDNQNDENDDEEEDDEDEEEDDEVEEEEENEEEKMRIDKESRRLIKEKLIKENALKAIDLQKEMHIEYDEAMETASSTANSSESSHRPDTPPAPKENATNNVNECTQDKNEDIFFSEELNRMYPNFDKIIGEHVQSLKSIKSIQDKVELITLDVQALNQQLEVKESEYNKLLYQKRIKEEILIRMLRQLKLLAVKKAPIEEKKYDLIALRQLEDAIAKYSPRPAVKEKQLQEMSAVEVIEKRAKMTRKELEIEQASWGPMKSMLNNIYPEENEDANESNKLLTTALDQQRHSIVNQYSESSSPLNASRQLNSSAQFPDDFADDFGEQTQTKNVRLLNQMMFQPDEHNDSSDMEIEVAPYSSTLEKLITKSILNRSHRSNPYIQKKFDHRNDIHMRVTESREFPEDISVVPVCKDTEYIPQTASNREQLVVRLKSPSIKLCQHCGSHEARFLCAACQNQWYCSRLCQVTAWNDHCDSCE